MGNAGTGRTPPSLTTLAVNDVSKDTADVSLNVPVKIVTRVMN